MDLQRLTNSRSGIIWDVVLLVQEVPDRNTPHLTVM